MGTTEEILKSFCMSTWKYRKPAILDETLSYVHYRVEKKVRTNGNKPIYVSSYI